jgi:hypothetical protein
VSTVHRTKEPQAPSRTSVADSWQFSGLSVSCQRNRAVVIFRWSNVVIVAAGVWSDHIWSSQSAIQVLHQRCSGLREVLCLSILKRYEPSKLLYARPCIFRQSLKVRRQCQLLLASGLYIFSSVLSMVMYFALTCELVSVLYRNKTCIWQACIFFVSEWCFCAANLRFLLDVGLVHNGATCWKRARFQKPGLQNDQAKPVDLYFRTVFLCNQPQVPVRSCWPSTWLYHSTLLQKR